MPPLTSTYTVSSGQTLSGNTLMSGVLSVGTITLAAGDTLIVASGGIAQDLTISGETVSVTAGGTTSNLVISNGGSEILTGSAHALNTSVFSGGVLTESGTTFVDTGLYVASGGLLDLTNAIGTQTSPVLANSGGRIEFGGVAATGAVSSSSTTSTTTLTVSAGPLAHESIVLSGTGLTFTSSTIGIGSAARDVFTITCFASGTKILTGTGEVAVNALHAGDTVAVQRNGETVQEPVIWVGKSRINLGKHAQPELAAPIRVKAGALAENVPTRDLVLSPEHCLIIDGLCVPVKLLVNGGSIAREYPAEPFDYYHIELEKHGILTADGAAAESYLDTGNRSAFDNGDSPRLLHPTFEISHTSERWKTDACAPLASVEDEVAPIWQQLADRSIALGHVVLAPAMVEGADLHILADGRRIQPISEADSRYVFTVPAGVQSVSLASRFCIPADKMVSSVRDTRRLGVSVNWIAIRSGDHEVILSADNPALQDGWNEAEQDGVTMWRWTNGAATIPWDKVTGPAVVTVRCQAVEQYPIYNETLALVA